MSNTIENDVDGDHVIVASPSDDGKHELEPVLKPGYCYLVREGKPEHGFELFIEMLKCGFQGLCISRSHPDLIQEKYDIDNSTVLWLSLSDYSYCISPVDVGRIVHVVSEFMHVHKDRSVVLLDGLEYLITNNGFRTVIRMVDGINETVMLNRGVFILPVSPETLDRKEIALLERNMEVTGLKHYLRVSKQML